MMDNYGYVPEESNGRPYTISRGTPDSKQINSNNLLVGISSRFKPIKKPIYYQRASIILAILVVILLIGLIVIVILYTKSKELNLCTSNQCIRSAANLKYSIDFSRDPCDNFYQFVCGKWSKEHPNHGWYASFSTFTTVTEKIVLEAIEVLSSEIKDSEPNAVGQAKKLYQSCISTENIKSLGIKPIFEYLKMAKLPLVPNFFNKTVKLKGFKFDWAQTEALLKVILAMDVFIGFTVQANIYQRNENVIYFGVLFQSCPLPSPFMKKYKSVRRPWKRNLFHWQSNMLTGDSKDDSDKDESDDEEDDLDEKREELRTKTRTNIIKHVVKEIMKFYSLVLPDDSELQMGADIINNITLNMDNLNKNYTLPEGSSGDEDTRKILFKELQELTDNNVKTSMPNFWINYISSIFESTNVTINPETDVLYTTKLELEYLWTIIDYVTSQPPANIELYMWWSTVYAMIINTDSNVTDYILSQTEIYYASTSEKSVYVRSRGLDCCELVNKYMPWAVSYAVADKTFANKTKPKVDKMIQDIKDSFMEHVKKIHWMDSETKKVTLEKSKEMVSFIGYPDWLFKDGAIDRKYEGIDINETTYLDNMVSIIMLYTMDTLTSLRLKNPRDWSTEAITVNAFNSFSDNAINVPMAILNYPLYDLGLEVLNYGSIGSILGHELTHGFDNAGRKYDKYGSYIQWWSNKTIETFENMTKCFINQYDNYTVKGIKEHIKGLATLGENLADNGGLNQAYTAYKRYQKKYGEEPKLPGFEHYSSDQMFFIAYGSIWCETLSLEDLKSQIQYDEHCPNAIRVIGTLQNSEEFAEAYNCPRNSFMNPDRKKCKIW